MNREALGKLLLLGALGFIVYEFFNQTAIAETGGPLDFGLSPDTGMSANTGTMDFGTVTTFDPTNDSDVLARTIYGEARGEIEEGKIAVGNVVMNRVNDTKNRWPKTPAQVCLQPLQFSCWNAGDPNNFAVTADPSVLAGDPVFADCQQIALAVLNGMEPDFTSGAQFYFNPAIASPSWAHTMTHTATIGHHVFYRES